MGNQGICVLNSTEYFLNIYLSMGIVHHRCNELAPREAFVIYPGAVWYTVGATVVTENPDDNNIEIVDLAESPTKKPATKPKPQLENKEAWLRGAYGGKKGGFFIEAVTSEVSDGRIKFEMRQTTKENVVAKLKKSPYCWRKRSKPNKKPVYWMESDGSWYPPKGWNCAESD